MLSAVEDTPRMMATFVFPIIVACQLAMGFLFVFFLLRVLLRPTWLAAVAFTVLNAVPGTLFATRPLLLGPIFLVQFGLFIFVLSRFGVLPMIVGVFVSLVLGTFPVTTTLGTWYAGSTLLAFDSVVALTAYALYVAIDRRPLVGEGFLERA
jgi:hypothetical protein